MLQDHSPVTTRGFEKVKPVRNPIMEVSRKDVGKLNLVNVSRGFESAEKVVKSGQGALADVQGRVSSDHA